MGILCDVTLAIGLEVPDAYIRVDTIAGYKGGFDCTANIYVSRDAFEGGASFIEQHGFSFVPDTSPAAPQIFEQAYAALKAEERFTEAVDVIEADD